MTSPIKLFMEKVDRDTGDGCWTWKTGKDSDGYGFFNLNKKTFRAHRWSYGHFKGKIQDGMFICHTCDNPSCVNPDHLYAGTHQDNMRDKIRRGRTSKGEDHGCSILTEEQVKKIFLLYKTGTYSQIEIARMLDVTNQQICFILNGKSWGHLGLHNELAVKNMLCSNNVGEKNPMSKLTRSEVVAISKLYQDGEMSLRAIGRKYKISHSHVKRIATGDSWKHVAGEKHG